MRARWAQPAASALLAASFAVAPAAAEIAGKRPTVVDGDTLILSGAAIELAGIDAPEPEQSCRAADGDWPCGQAARQALIHRIAFHWVSCVAAGHDADGRTASICYLGAAGGPELNAWMVARGWALSNPITGARYEHHEAEAKAAGRGLWSSRFVAPWAWRQGQRLP